MSFLNKMFGGGKRDKVQTTQESIQQLRETEDLLTKKLEHFDKRIATEIELAKKHGVKNKKRLLCSIHHLYILHNIFIIYITFIHEQKEFYKIKIIFS